MRTNTMREKVFEHTEHAFKHTQCVHDKLWAERERAREEGIGIDGLWPMLVSIMENVPVYHEMRFSLHSQAVVVYLLNTVVRMPLAESETAGYYYQTQGIPRYNTEEHVITISIADFLESPSETLETNGCLLYNPAEGF